MLVENVLPDAADLVRVKIIEARVEVERDDWGIVGDEDGFGLAENVGALLKISLEVCFFDECVVAGVLPAGAVVAAGAGEQVEEGIRIVVIADPARCRDVVVEFGLRGVKNFSLDLAQFNVHAQRVAPHLLKFHADLSVLLRAAAGSREEGVGHARKSFATGEACVGEKFARRFRLEAGRGGRGVIRHSQRHEMRCGLLRAFGEFGDDAILVRGEREGASHSRVVERFLRHVEAIKISAEVGEAMEVGSLDEHVHEFGGHEVFVPHDVGDTRLIKIERGVGRTGRQHINDLGRGVGGVPVTQIAQQTNLVVHAP